jgi:hypothetical protein
MATFSWDRFEPQIEEEPEPFDEFVHEVRVEAGLEEPRPPRPHWKRADGTQLSGQILWSGKITVTAPKYHKTLRGIDGRDPIRQNK